jgi:hypothetical protein
MAYLYHGTTMENLPFIVKYGLMPRQRGVFAFDNPSDATNWASTLGVFIVPEFHWARKKSGDYRTAMLRFDPEETGLTFRVDRAYGNGESFVTRGRISPEFIDVKIGDKWVSLKEYASRLP